MSLNRYRTLVTLKTIPAMVVPVFTGLGNFTPACFRTAFLQEDRGSHHETSTDDTIQFCQRLLLVLQDAILVPRRD